MVLLELLRHCFSINVQGTRLSLISYKLRGNNINFSISLLLLSRVFSIISIFILNNELRPLSGVKFVMWSVV